MKPGIERKPDSLGGGNALARIEQGARAVARREADLNALMGPKTLGDRFLGALLDFLPKRVIQVLPESIQEVINETPTAKTRAELRGAAHDTFEYLRDLLREGKERIEFHSDLDSLLQQAKVSEDREVLMQLRKKLRERAEQDLSLPNDDEVERFMEKLMERANEAQKQSERDKIISAVEDFLRRSSSVIQSLEATSLAAYMAHDNVVVEYSNHLELGVALDLLKNSNDANVRAAELGLTSRAVFIKSLEHALAQAKYTIMAVMESQEQASKPIHLEELEGLQKEAAKLGLPLSQQEQKKLNPVS